MLYEALYIPDGQEKLPREVIEEDSLKKYIVEWGKDQYDIAYVAEMDTELVGAIWGRLFSEQNKGFGFIDHKTPELSMAVKPPYRNRGIGTELIQTIAQAYRKKGVQQLSLSVDKANDASRLYKRLGCEVKMETDTSYTMIKRI